jgi:hypothetical protein
MTKADVFDCRDGSLVGEVEVDWDGYEAKSRAFEGKILAGEIFDRATVMRLGITGQTAVWLARRDELTGDGVDVEWWLEQ